VGQGSGRWDSKKGSERKTAKKMKEREERGRPERGRPVPSSAISSVNSSECVKFQVILLESGFGILQQNQNSKQLTY
jgi:hypothetical protein